MIFLTRRVEKSGIQQPSPTVAGRLEQARRWLEQPATDDRGLGRQAIFLVVDDANKVMISSDKKQKKLHAIKKNLSANERRV